MEFLGRRGYILPFKNRDFTDLVYLTWTDDPLTTMTIQWHTIENENPSQEVFYKEEDTTNWLSAIGTVRDMPVTNKKRKIHWTDLKGLKPNTGYEFRFSGDSPDKIYKFKTMPQTLNDRPIKIATSSDSHDHYSSSWFEQMTALMGGQQNGFDADIIIGIGDFTYDDGRIGQRYTDEWIDLLKHFQKSFVNSEGYIIPMVQTVGNHDTLYQREGIHAPDNAPNFKALFAFPTQDNLPTQYPFFGRLNFGDYLQLILLDTPWGSSSEVATPWMESIIDSSKKHIIPFVHYPLYSYRGGLEGIYDRIVNEWNPIFQNAGVKVVFDGHDHMYKRTHQLVNGEVVESGGITHCGSGTWQNVREHNRLENGEPTSETTFVAEYGFRNINEEIAQHFHGVTLYTDRIKVEAINSNGIKFHEFERLV